MSRIGKQSIAIPQGVTIDQEGTSLLVRGPKGELALILPHPSITVALKNKNTLAEVSEPQTHDNRSSAFWGLSRALLANAVEGVAEGFEKRLVIEGVGYRAEVTGDNLVLHLGFSHDITVRPPKGVSLHVEKNIITVSGIDKHLVGETAAKIREFRKPEPFKGKGIRYEGERVRRKEGKRAAAAA